MEADKQYLPRAVLEAVPLAVVQIFFSSSSHAEDSHLGSLASANELQVPIEQVMIEKLDSRARILIFFIYRKISEVCFTQYDNVQLKALAYSK